MAKYKREDLFGDEKESEQSHKSNDTVTKQSREKRVKITLKSRHRSIEETQDLIVFKMEALTKPIPRSMIAQLIGRKKGPWINAVIDDLVNKGVLLRYEVTRPNYASMYLYEIAR